MNTRWDQLYRTMTAVTCQDSRKYLWVTFKDGDVVEVRISLLAPSNSTLTRWQSVEVSSDGSTLVFATPQGLVHVPWDIVRRMTDPMFAREMVTAAERQAKLIGARLKTLRQQRGMTQKKVAEAAGIEPANLSRIESGKYDIASCTLWKILAAMGYTAADLATPDSEVPNK